MLLYTGHGKGKTSSALGVTMRAWGRGWKICWLQFIKSKTANYGETRAAARMGIEMIPLGDGFTWLSKDIEHHIASPVSAGRWRARRSSPAPTTSWSSTRSRTRSATAGSTWTR